MPATTRYFIIKATQLSALDVSMDTGLWQFGNQTEKKVNRSVKNGSETLLVFSVQGSGHFQGYARFTGIVSSHHVEAAELLERAGGPPLACHQTRFSVLDRKAETEGLLAKARELDVATVAYEPLALGRLAEGGAAREPDGEQAKKLGQLLQILQFIGSVNGGYTVAQAALGFCVAKGAVPIPGCASAARAAELAGLGDWRLDENEVAIVEEKLEFLGL